MPAVVFHPHARCCWCGNAFWQSGTLWVCPTVACAKRQNAWAIWVAVKDAPQTCLFLPTPRQVVFLETQKQFIRTLYGGAAAGAKSHILRWGLYLYALRVKNLSALIIRANYKDLEETHLLKMEKESALFGAKYHKGERRVTFPQTGATIVGGHMDDRDATSGYLSREYDIIVPDELVTYREDDMIELFSRARTSNPAVVEMLGGPKVWAASNPGPRGALWVRDFFITKTVDTAKYPKYKPEWHTFVQAKVDDNPYIDATYRDNLDQMPEPRRSQLLEGDWSVFEGAFFGAFKTLHQGRAWHMATRVVPAGTEWFASMDWGFNQPYCVLWWAVLPDGHLHIARELKGTQEDPVDVAQKMVALTRTLVGEAGRLRYVAADPSMWNKTGQDHGRAIVETFRAAGLPMRKADNQRGKNGWQNCHDLLRTAPDGTPWLTVDPSCRYFLRTFPIQEQSKHDADDVDSDGDDHAADACLVAGTWITTLTGPRAIETLALGTEVWTRAGWQPVEAVFSVGVRPVRTITLSDGTTITCTDDHPIWTAPGFLPAAELREGAPCLSWPIIRIGTAAWHGRSGARSWARFRRRTTFTTLMATLRTTRSIISRASLGRRIFRFMDGIITWGRGRVSNVSASIWAGRGSFAGPPVRPNFAGMPGWIMSSRRASNADGHSGPIATTNRSIARRPVPSAGSSIGVALVTADTAESSSWPALTAPSGVRSVVANAPAGSARVFNLTVASPHEYLANGVLVHNCRYGANSRPGPASVARAKPPVKGSVAYDAEQLRAAARASAY